MALQDPERAFLKGLYERVRDRPLSPERAEDRALYLSLYEEPGCYDPMGEIRTKIEWTEYESVQFLSGFNGSGKTTELNRLKKELEEAGCSVFMADYQDYLSPADPVEVSELLLVIAGAFGAQVAEALGAPGETGLEETVWGRLWHYLKTTEVELGEVGLTAEAGVAGFGKTGLEFKANLKSTPTFRQRVKRLLESRLAQLKVEVDREMGEMVKRVRQANGGKPVVFLFDSIEKLRGSFSNEGEVRRSVETLFSVHLPMLRFPNVHMVYAVPPWLKFIKQNVGSLVMLPCIRLYEKDDRPYAAGWAAMRKFLGLRIGGEADWKRLFGAPDEEGRYGGAEQMIGNSGGDFRTLLNLVREVLLRANRLDGLPVPGAVVDEACQAVRSQMLPVPIEEARRLDRIRRTKGDPLESDEGAEVAAVTRLLDAHRLLFLKNGGEWYDVHPLIREEVETIVKRNAARGETEGG